MNVIDDTKSNTDKLDGIIEIISRNIDGSSNIIDTKNIVVNNAKLILRDLVYSGNSATITKLVLGNMNLTPVQQTPPNTIPTANPDATTLINKLVSLNIDSKQLTTFTNEELGTRNAILYKFTLPFSEGNGIDGVTYYCELGLALDDYTLFTKKNIASLVKTNSQQFEFNYYLLF